MKIIINNFAATNGGGLTILNSFYKFICDSEEAKKHVWIFLLNDSYIEEKEHVRVLVIKNSKKNWKKRLLIDFFFGNKIVDEIKPDIILSMQNTVFWNINNPQFLYVHQIIPFQKAKNFSLFKADERKLAIYQHIIGKLIKESIKKSSKVIVQATWIKESISKEMNLNSDKFVVIRPEVPIINNRYKIKFNNNKFFYPANSAMYKNHELIYNAIEVLNKNGITKFEIMLTLDGEPYNENINNLGSNITREDVFEKYNYTTLIFPSYIETIGLPLLEARRAGTIILASDTKFSREALKKYENAYFFNPSNPEELADLISRVLNNEIVKKRVNLEKNMKSEWDLLLYSIESYNNESI